ncbi:MAG: TolC family protein, partial [Chromatiaceae bacterium]
MSPLRVASLLAAGLLGACMTVADRPDPPAFAETAGFSAPPPAADAEAVAEGLWWRNAVATGISTLLEQALRRNTTLREAQGTVQAAQARLAQATADRGPTLTVSADLRGQKVSDGDRTDSRSIGVDGDLPLDVSGALANREDAAAQALLADIADAQQLRSDLARDFLIAVIEAAEASQRAALLDEQIEVSQTLLRLIELRFTQGLASSVDVLQQRDELAGLRQQIPIAQLDRSLAANRLRLIASRTPDEPALPLLDRLPTVQAGFPTLRPIDL